ncbi:hypothetical protein DH2020_037269 [Rehmannia glutinosa]|uniref:Uncharacterized protein n=1 Tax=Rehmannia glutinosa TaxID=99300 RepID=A0ABR0V4J4_REHGL
MMRTQSQTRDCGSQVACRRRRGQERATAWEDGEPALLLLLGGLRLLKKLVCPGKPSNLSWMKRRNALRHQYLEMLHEYHSWLRLIKTLIQMIGEENKVATRIQNLRRGNMKESLGGKPPSNKEELLS